ncbi:hypothetical protein RhiirC2_395963 [Rhizophagus irregularis]|uniref:Uncharacterized protein n=1 Tax=Rhizophagus irregularis TaxID=588596 RepID=A0A2N1M6I4_9GLOM|nr:hypothetical protein RhiirC2_395963 [Rhizophagus irregularis]
MHRRYRRNSCRRIGAVRRKIGIYNIFTLFFSAPCLTKNSFHRSIIPFLPSRYCHTSKTIFRYGYFSSNHYFAYGIGDIYAYHEVIFIDLQGD